MIIGGCVTDLWDGRETPENTADLAAHGCIVGFSRDWAPSKNWPLFAGGCVRVSAGLAANEIGPVRHAALDGLGRALLPSAMVAEKLANGHLVPVLLDSVGTKIPICLVYADRDYIAPKVRVFLDRAVKVIAKEMPRPFRFADPT